MRFAIYSRKSVYSKAGDSIDNQIIDCKKRISMQYPDVSDNDIIVYSDEGYSGKNTERPEFQKMMKAIELGQVNCVVCYRLDRVSRSVSDFSGFLSELQLHGVTFISINENFDTSNPMGRAMIQIASVFAQLERETIAERVRDNMHALARKGQWLGGTPPLGYESEKVERLTDEEGKVKTVCNLRFNENEIDIVRIIFDKYLETKSYNAVSKYLIKNNIESRNGKIFSLLGIKEILQNPVYCSADEQALTYFTEHGADVSFESADCNSNYGLLAYNKRDHNKKNIPRNPIDKWIVSKGKHKSIISGEDWVTVQQLMAGNKPEAVRLTAVTHNDYALLSGMIRCSKCGSRMFAHTRYKDNHEHFYYICTNKKRGGVAQCDCDNLIGAETDAIVCQYLTQELNESSDIYRYLDKLKGEVTPRKQENPIESIDKRIKQKQAEKKNLLQALRLGATAALVQQINQEAAELDEELKSLESQRTTVEKESEVITNQELQVDLITEALTDLKQNFHSLTLYEKRTIIKLLVKEIVWDGENFNIFIYGE
jgi:site-specific DNA recombinase